LKSNYGLRFLITLHGHVIQHVEMPCLFNIDIRRENDPNYISGKLRGLKRKRKSADTDSTEDSQEEFRPKIPRTTPSETNE